MVINSKLNLKLLMNQIETDHILFLDLEPLGSGGEKVREIGVVVGDYQQKGGSPKTLVERILPYRPTILCGHNLRKFDYSYLQTTAFLPLIHDISIVDTLELSLLFFSEETLHKLPKPYKDDDPSSTNDPLQDALITKKLLIKVIERFYELPSTLQVIYVSLLGDKVEFKPFFGLLNPFPTAITEITDLHESIKRELGKKVESDESLLQLISDSPVELAYIISVLSGDIKEIKSFPIKLFYDFPSIQGHLNSITFNTEKEILNLKESANKFFGFDSFREFPVLRSSIDVFETNKTISQREIIESTLRGEDILTVLPTGGGKTFTFWLPALMKAKKTRAMTVVISPLQALMKDHIFNFNKKLSGIASAEALSGYLTMPQRRNIIERIINGGVDVLYLAPESLRSRNIENILRYRFIERIIIDEAHCLSTWGNDFRHDYFYIAQFIKKIQDKKYNQQKIPISCFTATANQNTIGDIEGYFRSEIGISFVHYIASPERVNLSYSANQYGDKNEKTKALISQIRNIKEPCLVYNPSSRKQCEVLSTQLSDDLGRPFYPFHAGLSSQEKNGSLKQFIGNEVDGIVATTAFGMGIDKPDIRHVVHYQVSPSLEDYMQESGRAGRDGKESYCKILYSSDDFDKLFFSVIRQKVTQPEIRKIYQSIKRYRGRKSGNERRIVVSVYELAESSGMQTDDDNSDYDTKVKTAVLELERAGYLRRGYNKPNVWVTAFHFESMEELHQKLAENKSFQNSKNARDREWQMSVVLLAQVLIKKSTKSISIGIEELSDILNLELDEVYKVLDVMKRLGLVSLEEDLLVSHIKTEKLKQLQDEIGKIKKGLFSVLQAKSNQRFRLKEIYQELKEENISIESCDYRYFLKHTRINLIKKGKFEWYRTKISDESWLLNVHDPKWLEKAIDDFFSRLMQVIIYLNNHAKSSKNKTDIMSPIAYHEMVSHCNHAMEKTFSINNYDKAVLFLHAIRLICIEGGRVIHHMQMEIYLDETVEAKKQYTKDDYARRMKPLYQRKRDSIHIINNYVSLLSNKDSIGANRFSIDYFTLPFDGFISKYNLKKQLKLPISEQRYNTIIKDLTSEQEEVVKDDKALTMLILAGPGTGKTKVLVSKIAYMIIEGDYKPEHFLMLTFTRSAAHEFKHRLYSLMGDLAYDIDIYTFHGYATELLGFSGDKGQSDKSQLDDLIPKVTSAIENNEIYLPFKNVIVLDEFQDVNKICFGFISALNKQFKLMESEDKPNEVRIIAVGDDDQCIMEMVNGSDINYMRTFLKTFGDNENVSRKWYKLTKNFRSRKELVACSNKLSSQIRDRVDPDKKMVSEHPGVGEVHLHYYKGSNFLAEVRPFIQESDSKSIAVIAHENEQVLSLYSVLKEDSSLDVSYLLKNDGFRLSMLDEINSFTNFIESNLSSENNIINQQLFDDAKSFLKKEYAESGKLHVALGHIAEFEEKHELLTLSLWNTYSYEVNVEELESVQSKVVVSTIHRTKGKEFDEVHVLLQKEHNQNDLDYFYRLYYVALTRAKSKLHIHSYPTKPFQALENLNVKVHYNKSESFNSERNLVFIMGLEDVFLGFTHHESRNVKPISGMAVEVLENESGSYSIRQEGFEVARTSKSFRVKLQRHLSRGYVFDECLIEYVVNYYLSDKKRYNKVVLCRMNLVMPSGS